MGAHVRMDTWRAHGQVRMGDPETQVVLPLLQSDLYEVMLACTQGKLAETDVRWASDSAATVVMAAPGYPGSYPKGLPISGIAQASLLPGVTVYHAGTKKSGADSYVSSGGRVLAVTGRGASLEDAVAKAYAGVARVAFECPEGAHFRTDIAAKAFGQAPEAKKARLE